MNEDQDKIFVDDYQLFKRNRENSGKSHNTDTNFKISVNLDSDMSRNVKRPRKSNHESSLGSQIVRNNYHNSSDGNINNSMNQKLEAHDIGLYKEYVQWNYINNHLYPFGEGILSINNSRVKQEYINTMQRWLIYINESFNEVPKYEYFTILPNIDENHVAAEFLSAAFFEKHFCYQKHECKNVVKRILSDIRLNHDKISPFNIHPALNIRYDLSDSIIVVEKFTSVQVPRINLLLKKADIIKTARMLLRYESFGNGSYQWGDPNSVHKSLYENFYVRYEGFASPVNSRFIEYDDTHFCSLFLDTDEPFGSLGDFFNVDMSKHTGGWSVNPPFLNDLMKKVADHIVLMLDRSYPVYFFCTFPRWTDDDGWITLNKTKHLHRQFDLKPRHFEVQDAYGRLFTPNMEMTMFVLGKIPLNCKFTELGNILVINPRESMPEVCPW